MADLHNADRLEADLENPLKYFQGWFSLPLLGDGGNGSCWMNIWRIYF
jgi:hypothetical protein